MRSMVEGASCRAPNPLRQRFALPPPLPGEDKAAIPCSISGRQLAFGRHIGEDARPQFDRRRAIAGARQCKSVEERRRRPARRHFRRALVRKLGRRGEPVSMIHKRIAEPDPQLLVRGVAAHRVAQDTDGVLGLAIAGKRLGHQEPRFLGAEIPEEGMARLRQWHHVACAAALRRRTREPRLPLQRIAGRSEEQRRCRGFQQTAPHAEQPQRGQAERE